jgi:hypothetical protein
MRLRRPQTHLPHLQQLRRSLPQGRPQQPHADRSRRQQRRPRQLPPEEEARPRLGGRQRGGGERCRMWRGRSSGWCARWRWGT